jgi:hypothetical protein
VRLCWSAFVPTWRPSATAWLKPCLSIACNKAGWSSACGADATDYTLPQEFALELSGKPTPMMQRPDAKLVEKSLV